MAKDWQRITRGDGPIEPRLTPGERRIEIRVPLSASPPREWSAHFVASYIAVRDRGDDWPLPEFHGASIVSWPLRRELRSWIETMLRRIEESSDWYEEHFLPEQAREKAEKDEADRLAQGGLESIRREIADL